MTLKNTIRGAMNRMGFDVIRINKSPRRTLLGMAGFDFGTVIDVGANRGQFAREISAFFPNAHIYSFEPLEGPYRELSDWATRQNGRVRCFQTALGESTGEVEMHQHDDHSPSSSLLAATDTCHELYPQTRSKHITKIQITTMDNALGEKLSEMPRSILLKLDVQGFEDRVLRGGLQILSQCQVVLLEVGVQSLYQAQANFRVITNLLYDAGFEYAGNLDQAYSQDGRVVFLDAVFAR
jgi:FkbM family methyltransferase